MPTQQGRLSPGERGSRKELLPDPLSTMDADAWATEFCKLWPHPNYKPDFWRDLMLGWFANAIMCGHDHARREIEAEVDRYGLALKAENEKLREACIKVAFAHLFPDEVNDLTGDVTKWSSTICYEAIGGRMQGGVRLDDIETFTKTEDK